MGRPIATMSNWPAVQWVGHDKSLSITSLMICPQPARVPRENPHYARLPEGHSDPASSLSSGPRISRYPTLPEGHS